MSARKKYNVTDLMRNKKKMGKTKMYYSQKGFMNGIQSDV